MPLVNYATTDYRTAKILHRIVRNNNGTQLEIYLGVLNSSNFTNTIS